MADAFRMVFSYTADGTISLVHRYRADMAIPMNAALPESPGFHLVGRDINGVEKFRVGARGLFAESYEVFGSNGEISQVAAPSHGTFMTVLPYSEDLEHVAIVQVEQDATKIDADLMRATLRPEVRETELTRFMIN